MRIQRPRYKEHHNLINYAAASYADRVKGDLNVIVGIVGGPGTGKSSLAQTLAEILRDDYGFKFDVDKIFFEPADFLDAISMRRSVVILDEAGVAINARLFMTQLNQAISFATQTSRFKNNVLIFIAPHVNFIDKAVRTLLMHIWRTMEIKEDGVWTRVAKPYTVVTNFVSDRVSVKPATYMVDDEVFEYPWMHFRRPSEELWTEYLKRKEEWWEKAKQEWKDMIAMQFKDSFEVLKDKYIQVILENRELFMGRGGKFSAAKIEYFPWDKYNLPPLQRKAAYKLVMELSSNIAGANLGESESGR